MTDFKVETLFESLAAGQVVVTGNSRLANALSARYGHWRMGRGDRQWPSPRLLSWSAWIESLWEEAGLAGRAGGAVPGRQQLLSLWEDVLAEDNENGVLLRPESLAGPAADTRQLVVDWAIDADHPSWRSGGEANENHRAFHRWNRAFEARCRQQGWVPPEDRLPRLTRAVREHGFLPPGPVWAIGFDEFTPAQRAFLDALAEAGTRVASAEPPAAADRAVMWKSTDGRDELERMARWVRLRHEENPAAVIGVVVDGLGQRRAEIERQLGAILAPDRDGGPTPWNVSMGTPLSSEPVVAAAFDLLRLAARRIDIQDAGRVLRSPWIRGGRSERASRALLEKTLREEYPRQFDLGELAWRAGEILRRDREGEPLPEAQHRPQPWNSPEMKTIAGRLRRFFFDARPMAPSAWAQAIDTLLESAGWPHGDGDATADEHDRAWQAIQRWQEVLREFSSLDAVSGALALAEAVNRLQRVCRETVFQPRTPPANIQVLGLYEAIGLRFDHLWVLGLHNDNWPPAPQRNPFIPVALQRDAGLPKSGPQRELEVARRVTRRLLEAAPDCVFSFPGQVDGEETLPSPLLVAAAVEPVAEVPGWSGVDWPGTVHAHRGLETDPLLDPGPLQVETARGGTSILKNQAACPFRAFAVNRLGAEGLEAPADGITPMLHGSLVHKVLEQFWKETRRHDELLALDECDLRERVGKHVEAVLDERRDMKHRPAFRAVEAGRLLRLSLDLLALEKERAPFEATGFEQAVEYAIEGQVIRLVIDRIDRLQTGEEVIIDYKTGTVKPDQWFGERPEEPQLPLYAVSAARPPAAVVYAVVRNDGCLFSGLVNAPGLFPGLPRPGKAAEYLDAAGRDLAETAARWKAILHGLMAEFLSGRAGIQPLNGRRTCDAAYCDLQPLCRIGELERLPLRAQTAERDA